MSINKFSAEIEFLKNETAMLKRREQKLSENLKKCEKAISEYKSYSGNLKTQIKKLKDSKDLRREATIRTAFNRILSDYKKSTSKKLESIPIRRSSLSNIKK